MKTCVSELFILAPTFKYQRVGLQCDQTVMCLSVVIVVAVDILTFREINVLVLQTAVKLSTKDIVCCFHSSLVFVLISCS